MKFYIQTLGCKVNTYESNIIKDILIDAGYTETDDIADIYIINTCTVTNTASSKSMHFIRQAINKNPKAIIIVVGCLPQEDTTSLEQLKDISIILGNKNKSKITEYINEYQHTKKQIIDIKDLNNETFETMTLNNFDKTRAFVKIEDGCENFCSYCIIPYTRGNVRSKPSNEVLEEIKNLVDNGHKEIVLTGIHTGHYGSDLKDYQFKDLLLDILKIKNLKRLRISSIEITEITNDIINIIKDNNIIVDHLHIPLQSGCDKTLKDMNRKYDITYFINKIKAIRTIRPNISITTDVIVGFPDETEADFNTTINNIKEINFSKIHVFPYSIKKGTKASTMPNQIPENIKKERVKILIQLSKTLEQSYMEKFINQEIEFIPETYKDGYLFGHTGNYLLIKHKGNIEELRKQFKVKITKIEYPYCLT